MITIPHLPRRAVLIGLCYGGIILSWLSLEDNSVLPAVLIGISLSLLIALRWLFVRLGGKLIALNTALFGGIALGALIGAGAALATAALMLFKNGFHAHVFPDYPGGMIVEILLKTPAWTLAGGLCGLGVVLLMLAFGKSAQSA